MDDIMERLRATSTAPLIHCGEESTDPCCWFCGEYDCHPADCHFRTGKSVTHEPCPCAKCTRDPKGYYCSCTCHHDWPSPLMLEAADEIERLRALCNDLYHDATCFQSFCKLCGEGIREWEATCRGWDIDDLGAER